MIIILHVDVLMMKQYKNKTLFIGKVIVSIFK